MNFNTILTGLKSHSISLFVLPFDISIFCYNRNLNWNWMMLISKHMQK
jgi:hypothetical protein